MKIGVILPHGVWDEFRGLSPHEGWRGMLKVAVDAEELGFESIWLSDHFTAVEDLRKCGPMRVTTTTTD